jgi:hypothetical protein
MESIGIVWPCPDLLVILFQFPLEFSRLFVCDVVQDALPMSWQTDWSATLADTVVQFTQPSLPLAVRRQCIALLHQGARMCMQVSTHWKPHLYFQILSSLLIDRTRSQKKKKMFVHRKMNLCLCNKLFCHW